MNLRVGEVSEELIEQSRIFHFGSLSMTHPGIREATKKALSVAKEQGCIISYDPNLRPPLWNTLDEAKEQIAFGMTQCDILKISDNEIQWFTGLEDYDAGIRYLQQTYHIPMILLSMGPAGSRAYYHDLRVEVAPFLQENTIETTGAGDTFCACVLNYVLDHGLDHLTEAQLCEMLRFANAAASLITTRKGALKVMPAVEDVNALLNKTMQL